MSTNLFAQIEEKFGFNTINRRIFVLLKWVVVIVGIFLIANILFPTAVSIILNILWILLLFLVILFFSLGLLTVVGMRKEVSRVLDVLLEGSLTIIDFLQFLKEVWKQFVILLQEFVIYAAAVFAYILCFIIYVLLLLLYKYVGTSNDVTLLTIILTIAMVGGFGILNKPVPDVFQLNNWKARFKKKFKQGFIDGTEIILFLFFLTMDSTKLFFIPASLNIPLYAQFGEHDLMVKSFNYSDDFRFTLNLIVAAITIEVLRNILRIVAMAKFYYHQEVLLGSKDSFTDMLKRSVRKSFVDLKDDIIRFITFTTVLFFVFMFFPKLKLLTLVLASGTNMLLDIFIRERLVSKKATDLISRTLTTIFRV